jgi:hypothetical protein
MHAVFTVNNIVLIFIIIIIIIISSSSAAAAAASISIVVSCYPCNQVIASPIHGMCFASKCRPGVYISLVFRSSVLLCCHAINHVHISRCLFLRSSAYHDVFYALAAQLLVLLLLAHCAHSEQASPAFASHCCPHIATPLRPHTYLFLAAAAVAVSAAAAAAAAALCLRCYPQEQRNILAIAVGLRGIAAIRAVLNWAPVQVTLEAASMHKQR